MVSPALKRRVESKGAFALIAGQFLALRQGHWFAEEWQAQPIPLWAINPSRIAIG